MGWIGNNKDADYEEKNRVSSYRGYLLKMRRSHNLMAPQWGKRWFSIEGRYFRWYRQDTDLISSGMIDLRHVRSITKVDINGAFTFCVTCDDRNLIMRASSAAEMNGWIRALHMQADIARGGTGMNLVSDFNEAPFSHSMAFPKKNARSRGSLTLEQQLDLNLRKLDELEQELRSREDGDDTAPTGSRYRRREQEDKYKDEDDEKYDEGGSELHYYSNTQASRSKAGKLRSSSQNRNPLAEAPSAQQAQYWRATGSRLAYVTGGLDIPRTESNESLDMQSAVPSRRSESYGTAYTHSGAASAGVVGPSAEYAAKWAAAGVPGVTGGAVRRDSKGSVGGEADGDRRSFDSDSEQHSGSTARRKVPVHTGGKHMPTTASIYTNPNHVALSSGNINMNMKAPARQPARVRTASSDSLDSVEFSYIPDIAEEGGSRSPERRPSAGAKIGGVVGLGAIGAKGTATRGVSTGAGGSAKSAWS